MAAECGVKQVSPLPVHVAIVPDGNGRWAEQRGLPRLRGHQKGAENLRNVLEYLNDCSIKCVTIYSFSTENWNRPQEEVKGLFKLSARMIEKNTPRFHEKGIQLRHVGRIKQLPEKLQTAINKAVDLTRDNAGMKLNLAFNYGGRSEILDAVARIVNEGIAAEKIDEKLFSRYLYTAGLPDVDLLIRTGDELRLSNFLLWQTAYSEYYFTEALWPDFSREDVDKALVAYSQRKRRFGGLNKVE